ncbi:MAG: DUF4272 domain-containing protein [Massilia sp.]
MFKSLRSLFGGKAAPTPAAPTGELILFNAYCTRLEIAQPSFAHVLHARRDLADPELLEHLNGFCGYVLARGDGAMSRDKYHVILHLQRVQQHLSISVGVNDTAALHAWAADANALLFTQNGDVTDPQGRVLVGAADGLAVADARMPYLPSALARKAATEAALAARGLNTPDTLPALVCEEELALRENDAVVERARALLLVALRAESVASGEPMPVATLLSKMPLADDALSAQEQIFLDQEAPSQNDCAQLIWRYESLYLLEWALGLVDVLPFPDAPVDSATTVATLIEMRGPRLRPATEILDALDLHYRLHWHVRQARLKQQGAVAGVDADVVMERHRALNWLVRFQHAGWDDVDTPT